MESRSTLDPGDRIARPYLDPGLMLFAAHRTGRYASGAARPVGWLIGCTPPRRLERGNSMLPDLILHGIAGRAGKSRPAPQAAD